MKLQAVLKPKSGLFSVRKERKQLYFPEFVVQYIKLCHAVKQTKI